MPATLCHPTEWPLDARRFDRLDCPWKVATTTGPALLYQDTELLPKNFCILTGWTPNCEMEALLPPGRGRQSAIGVCRSFSGLKVGSTRYWRHSSSNFLYPKGSLLSHYASNEMQVAAPVRRQKILVASAGFRVFFVWSFPVGPEMH